MTSRYQRGRGADRQLPELNDGKGTMKLYTIWAWCEADGGWKFVAAVPTRDEAEVPIRALTRTGRLACLRVGTIEVPTDQPTHGSPPS